MRARARLACGPSVMLGAALLVPAAVSAQGVVPLGPRFVVEDLASERYAPRYLDLALDRDGGGLVAWTMLYGSIGNDSSVSSVQARRIGPDGAPRGAQFQVNAYTTSSQSESAVSFAADGSALVVWESSGSFGSDDSGDSVQLRRFDGAGEPVGSEFQVHQFATGSMYGLDLAPHPDGGFVAAWSRRDGEPVSRNGARGRRFGPTGVASTPEQPVSTDAPALWSEVVSPARRAQSAGEESAPLPSQRSRAAARSSSRMGLAR